MLKILHTADIHLGARLAKLGEKTEEQRAQIQKTFERIVDTAIEKQVDVFLIAGDLFDINNPEKNLIDFVLSNLARLNDRHIYTCIALGTHDYQSDEAISKTLQSSEMPYIHIFTRDGGNRFDIEGLNTVVWCNPAISNRGTLSPLEEIVRDDGRAYNIAMAHGSVQIPGKSSANDSPITQEEIEATRMDYIALGHWHNQQEVGKGNVKAWYSGAPEMIDLDQTNSGKILYVEIDDNHQVDVQSITIGKRFFDELHFSMNTVVNFEDLVNKIRVKPNTDLIRTVVLEGIIDVSFGQIDEDEIRRRIGNEFFYIVIKDNTHVSVEDIMKSVEGHILRQKFIENIQKMGLDEETANEAMKYGVMLLDGTAKIY